MSDCSVLPSVLVRGLLALPPDWSVVDLNQALLEMVLPLESFTSDPILDGFESDGWLFAVASVLGVSVDDSRFRESYLWFLSGSRLSAVVRSSRAPAAFGVTAAELTAFSVRRVREFYSLNIGQMAEALGVSRSTYSQWERGLRVMPEIGYTALRWLHLGRVDCLDSDEAGSCDCGNPLDCVRSVSGLCECGQPADTCICG